MCEKSLILVMLEYNSLLNFLFCATNGNHKVSYLHIALLYKVY